MGCWPVMMENTKANEFLKLLMQNQRRIYAFILAMVPHHEDANDLFQETILRMWSKFDEFGRGTSFAAWGITIAKFQILNARKQHARRCLQLSLAAQELLQRDTDRFIPHIDRRMQILRACIQKLKPADYGLIQMRYEQEMTVKTMAESFGHTVQNIYRRMARVHETLLRCVRRTLETEGSA